MIYYRTLGYDDVNDIVADIVLNNCIINPTEEGTSGEVGLNNILYDTDGNYYDFTYLGHAVTELDEDGNPIEWSQEVFAHIAGKTDISLVLTEGVDYTDVNHANRFLGEPIAVPAQLPSMSWNKPQIRGWLQNHFIPYYQGWNKQRLVLAALLWYNINN